MNCERSEQQLRRAFNPTNRRLHGRAHALVEDKLRKGVLGACQNLAVIIAAGTFRTLLRYKYRRASIAQLLQS
jgi:hypothetical protein